jgi:hypothetical protein
MPGAWCLAGVITGGQAGTLTEAGGRADGRKDQGPAPERGRAPSQGPGGAHPHPSRQPRRIDRLIREQFRAYRATLQDDRRHLLERFQVVDLAGKVVGVGSVGTRAFIVLLQGRDQDDPLFLQVKEATASVLEDHLPKSAEAGYVRGGPARVRPRAVHPLPMMAWKCDLAHSRGMRQGTFAATVLAFMLGLAISLAWSLVGSYGS